MGFPTWTLWGMGLSAAAALLVIAMAYIGQSPGFMRRVGLDVYRLDLRVRALTGYAFALLLLAIGFFAAGVPLSPDSAETAQANSGVEAAVELAASTVEVGTSGIGVTREASLVPTATPRAAATSSTPVTGSFGGRPPTASGGEQVVDESGAGETNDSEASAATVTSEEPAAPATETPQPESSEAGIPDTSATPRDTAEPTATATQTATVTPSPTATASPTPTVTPSPTLTPTPIVGETATVDGNGGGVWVFRSPGGQQVALVNDGELVILLPGHANQGGMLWQEIMTLSGVSGWIDVDFLIFDETDG